MLKIGWFSTGRDQAARDLLKVVFEEKIVEICFVLCNRIEGESKESDLFISQVKEYGILPVLISSAKFKPELWRKDREIWRNEFDQLLLAELQILNSQFKFDLIMLAGYMLILSSRLCQAYPFINLHPAQPGGPKGSWQEVIYQLIDKKERESGVMIHLVTPQLDEGPPLTYCTFQIREFDFDKIRKQGLKREIPLIVETLKLLSQKEIKIEGGKILDKTGKYLEGGYDLTQLINKKIKSRR